MNKQSIRKHHFATSTECGLDIKSTDGEPFPVLTEIDATKGEAALIHVRPD